MENTQPQPATASPALTKPVVCILIGMAGSGKTTLMQRINSEVQKNKKRGYIINLDPAVSYVPYQPNIDIRETVNYKEVMKQYGLGPNGGILTSLNLFATRFDQVMNFLETRAPNLDYVFLDTPGQIEVFNWSASGQVIVESLASRFPTCVAYVVDTPRCTAPATFMSNMLYACSIMYKTKLPLTVLFNKADVTPHAFAERWMTDWESFQDTTRKGDSYMSTLTQSMSMVLDEFYSQLARVGVSAMTGEGLPAFFQSLDAAAQDYLQHYRPYMEAQIAKRREREQARITEDAARIRRDMAGVLLDDDTANVEGHPERKRPAAREGEEEVEESAGLDIEKPVGQDDIPVEFAGTTLRPLPQEQRAEEAEVNMAASAIHAIDMAAQHPAPMDPAEQAAFDTFLQSQT